MCSSRLIPRLRTLFFVVVVVAGPKQTHTEGHAKTGKHNLSTAITHKQKNAPTHIIIITTVVVIISALRGKHLLLFGWYLPPRDKPFFPPPPAPSPRSCRRCSVGMSDLLDAAQSLPSQSPLTCDITDAGSTMMYTNGAQWTNFSQITNCNWPVGCFLPLTGDCSAQSMDATERELKHLNCRCLLLPSLHFCFPLLPTCLQPLPSSH